MQKRLGHSTVSWVPLGEVITGKASPDSDPLKKEWEMCVENMGKGSVASER